MGLANAYCNLSVQRSRYEQLLRLPPKRLIQGGVPRARRRATHTPPAVAAEIASAYRAGATVGELAERSGVHRATVDNLLAAAGVARRPRGLNEAQAEQAVLLYADGLSIAKIARQFGVAPSGIDRLLKRRGLVLRDRHWRAPRREGKS